MPTPKTVSTDINSLLSAANKAAARTVLEAETAGAAAAVAAAKQDASADLTAYADAADAAARRALIGAADAATNTGDEDQTSILAKIGNGTRIGAEFLPDALSGDGAPNGIATVTGTLTSDGSTPVVFPDLPYVGLFQGKANFSFDNNINVSTAYFDGIEWVLSFLDGTAQWTSTANVATPDLVPPGEWNADTNPHAWKPVALATGTPVVTIATPASHIGQFYRDTNTGIWYRWNGTVWELDAGDEDQTSILTKIGDGTRIGAEFLPDALSTAADVTFTPAGSIAATDVQAALVELDGDIAGKAASGHDHTLSAITDAGTAAAAALIDDDTFATATSTNIPSAESVKAYVDASGGTVDNAAVVAAIEQDRSAVKKALRSPDVINAQKYASLKAGGTVPMRWLHVGDSLASSLEIPRSIPITGYFGQGSLATTGSNAAQVNTNNWVTGKMRQFLVGSTYQFSHGGGEDKAYDCNKVEIAWLADETGTVGDGFDVEFFNPNTSVWTKAGTTQTHHNAGGLVGRYAVFDAPSGSVFRWKIRITNITGKTLNLLFWGAYENTNGGVIQMHDVCNLGGISPTFWNNVPSAVFDPIWAGIAPDVAICRWADEAADWQTGGAFRSLYANCKAIKPDTDWVLLPQNPVYNDPAWESLGFTTWASGQSYALGKNVYSTNSITGIKKKYTATSAHSSLAATKPGEGADWQTVWAEFAYDAQIISDSESRVAAQVAAQREFAEEFDETFINVVPLFYNGDYIKAFQDNLISDQVHSSGKGNRKVLQHLYRLLPLIGLDWGSFSGWGRFNAYPMPGSPDRIRLDKSIEALALRGWSSDQGDRRDKAFQWSQKGDVVTLSINSEEFLTLTKANNNALTSSRNLAIGSTTERIRTFVASVSAAHIEKTADYTPTSTDHTIRANATSAPITITLPGTNAAGVDGRIYVIKKTDASANAVTVTRTSTNTIEGATTVTLANQWDYIVVQSLGSSNTWIKISGNV